MTAKEMFKELGFEFDTTEYKAFKPDFNYTDYDGNGIIFDLENERIDIITITTIRIKKIKKLTEAINKQVEELGWNE